MKYKIICHRGINRLNENTFEDITKVIYLKNDYIIYGVEFDIQITNDNYIICYHDDTLKRIHKHDKRIYDLTIDDINKFNLPSFNKIIEYLSQNKNLIIDIELKIYPPYDINKLKFFCTETVEICKKYNIVNQCIFTSFEDKIIEELLNLYKDIKIGLISDKNCDMTKFIEFKKLGLTHFIIHKDSILDIINLHNILLIDTDIWIYTLFNIEHKEDKEKDIELINKLKFKNYGLITDDHNKTYEILLNVNKQIVENFF